nr:unnamed protein product [Callosobruchus analis]
MLMTHSYILVMISQKSPLRKRNFKTVLMT